MTLEWMTRDNVQDMVETIMNQPYPRIRCFCAPCRRHMRAGLRSRYLPYNPDMTRADWMTLWLAIVIRYEGHHEDARYT